MSWHVDTTRDTTSQIACKLLIQYEASTRWFESLTLRHFSYHPVESKHRCNVISNLVRFQSVYTVSSKHSFSLLSDEKYYHLPKTLPRNQEDFAKPRDRSQWPPDRIFGILAIVDLGGSHRDHFDS